MDVVEVATPYRMRYAPVDPHLLLGGSVADAWDDALGASIELVDLDLNREGCTVSADDMVRAEIVDPDTRGNREFVDCLHVAFKWNDGDNDVLYWYPQGLTGSYDAVGGHGLWGSRSRRPDDGEDAEPSDGRKLLLVSWYCVNIDPNANFYRGGLEDPKGIRVSVVDVTDWDDPICYRHVLLVRPFLNNGVLDFEEVTYINSRGYKTSYHGGGLAWYGRWLYVAATDRLLVFDLLAIKEVEGFDDDRCGLHGGTYHARGYRYVCPLVAEYLPEDDGGPPYFSSVAVDRSATPHRLLAGKYLDEDDDLDDSLVTWWELDPSSGRIVTTATAHLFHSVAIETWVESVQAIKTYEYYMQGVLSLGDDFWISGQRRLLYADVRTGADREYEWPYGCEDLTYSARSGNLWCLTEFTDPARRFVFAVKIEDFLG